MVEKLWFSYGLMFLLSSSVWHLCLPSVTDRSKGRS
nr:MAG TPA: hypothetical protein [Caudoviricetes sp.]